MKTKLILLLCAALLSAGCFTSCKMLQQPANCFGPPSPEQVESHNALTTKLLSAP